jgi:hypothetical protein
VQKPITNTYHIIKVDGEVVYAATDPRRFVNEAKKFAGVRNASFAGVEATPNKAS